MASQDPNRDIMCNILDKMVENYPAGDVLPTEIEFALAGFNGPKFDNTWNLGISRFGAILKGLIAKLNADTPSAQVMITVISPTSLPASSGTARARIMDDGTGSVAREFCITNKCHDETIYELKKRMVVVDMPEFGVRLRYSTEYPLPEPNVKELKDGIESRTVAKRYRYAQRYTLDLGTVGKRGTTLKVDFSSVKSNTNDAYTFSAAQIVGMCANKALDMYEVELELANPNGVTKEDLEQARETSKLAEVLQYLIIQAQGGVSNVIHDGRSTAIDFRNYLDMCHQLWPDKNLPVIEVQETISQQNLQNAAGYFLGPQIATIDRGVLKQKKLQPVMDKTLGIYVPTYFFTDKADGERCLLYINKDGKCSLIMRSAQALGKRSDGLARTLSFIPTDLTVTVPDVKDIKLDDQFDPEQTGSTVLDGELIENKAPGDGPKFYFLSFDIIVFKDQYVDISLFRDRLGLINSIKAMTAEGLGLKAKLFYSFSSEEFKNVVENTSILKFSGDPEAPNYRYTGNGLDYELDGFVFQPADELYPALEITWRNVYKFKPMHMLTVDLHLNYDRKMATVTSIDLGMSKSQEHPLTYGQFTASHKCSAKSRTCHGDLDDSPYPCYALIENGYPRTINKEVINRGSIVECRMTVNKGSKPYWEPIRVRHDKSIPNGYAVHNQVLTQLNEPINLENFYEVDGGFGGKGVITDHNRWESNLFITSTVKRIQRGDVNLLDLACGNIKSGMAWMAIQQGFNKDKGKRTLKIVGVDVCKDNATKIANCYIYMGNINDKYPNLFRSENYGFYKEDMTNPLHRSSDIELKPHVRQPESFHVITCIFAIYYTFQSELSFRNFLANVSRNLKTGGMFVCSYMNASKVKNLTNTSTKDATVYRSTGKWRISVPKNKNDSPFGHEAHVTFPGLYEKENTEYLVDLNDSRILDIMRLYGLELDGKAKGFATTSKKLDLMPDEQAWAGLHENICFVKKPMDESEYDLMFEQGNDYPTTASKASVKKPPVDKSKSKSKPVAQVQDPDEPVTKTKMTFKKKPDTATGAKPEADGDAEKPKKAKAAEADAEKPKKIKAKPEADAEKPKKPKADEADADAEKPKKIKAKPAEADAEKPKKARPEAEAQSEERKVVKFKPRLKSDPPST